MRVTVGGSTWTTSIFPDSARGCYVLPIKRAVRKAEALDGGDIAPVTVDKFGEPRSDRSVLSCGNGSRLLWRTLVGMAVSSPGGVPPMLSLPGAEVAREEVSGGEGGPHALLGSEGVEVEVGCSWCDLPAGEEFG